MIYKLGQVRRDGMILTSFGWLGKGAFWVDRSELNKAIEAGWRLVEGRDCGNLVRVKRGCFDAVFLANDINPDNRR